jgi:hypothetical protein
MAGNEERRELDAELKRLIAEAAERLQQEGPLEPGQD